MKKTFIIVLMFSMFVVFVPQASFAHPEGLNFDDCHICSSGNCQVWDVPEGALHCHTDDYMEPRIWRWVIAGLIIGGLLYVTRRRTRKKKGVAKNDLPKHWQDDL